MLILMLNFINFFRKNKKRRLGFLILFIFISIIFTSALLRLRFGTNIAQENTIIIPAGVKEYNDRLWVDNPTFNDPIEPTWFPTYEGDVSDVLASTSTNQANFEIIGDSNTQQVLLNSETFSNWEAFNKSESAILPQRTDVPGPYYGVDSDGAWCTHRWWEQEAGGQPKNTPEMHWRTNVSLDVDMSDYIITAVDFEAVINASVDMYIDTPGDRYARAGFLLDQHTDKYDFVRFYVEIATLDVDELSTYRIAFNQTRLLGNESLSLYDIEGLIGTYGDQAIIDALTNVLAIDPGHNNFTVVLGIYMYCEDNQSGYDLDDWTELRIKTLNLTFSYVKKIDQYTTLSWNQELDAINGTNVQVTKANLRFEFKIDKNWTSAAQNSKFRIFIDDRKFEDSSLDLIEYTNSPNFQEAKAGGYNLLSKILPYEEFNLSIQVYLAEDFGLEDNIIISIRNVYLVISYTERFPDVIPEPLLFLGLFIIALIAAITTAAYLIAYQTYLKYPIPIRKVRKYRKTLPREKDPSVNIITREKAFDRTFQKEVYKSSKFLKGIPVNGKMLRDKMLEK